jgi:hypothetical protein
MSEPLSQEQREEDFREFQADHLRRQTVAIESIRTIMVLWLILTIVGAAVIVSQAARG